MSSVQVAQDRGIQMRNSKRFKDAIEEIKEIREAQGFPKKLNSDKFITALIVRHKFWGLLKLEIIKYGGKN